MSKVAKRYRELLEVHENRNPAADIDYDNDSVILEMVKILTADMDDTIEFLGECTGDEFVWLSEIFEEIARATHSQQFVDALRVTAERYPEECERYDIDSFIEEAQDIVQQK